MRLGEGEGAVERTERWVFGGDPWRGRSSAMGGGGDTGLRAGRGGNCPVTLMLGGPVLGGILAVAGLLAFWASAVAGAIGVIGLWFGVPAWEDMLSSSRSIQGMIG